MSSALTVIGNTNLDVLVGGVRGLPAPGTEQVVGEIGVRLGGSAGNLALRAAQLEVPTRLVSRLGTDPVAGMLSAALEHPCLEANLVATQAPSPVTVAVEAPGQDRAFLSSLGAMAELRADDVEAEWLRADLVALAGTFLLPGLGESGGAELLHRAHEHGAATLVDVGWPPSGWTAESRQQVRDLLGECDYFLPNTDEVNGLSGADSDDDPGPAAAALAEEFDTTIVLKCGAGGAQLHRPGTPPVTVEAPSTEVVDSTGAGDSLNAAFIAGLYAGQEAEASLRSAVRFASALVATAPAERGGVRLEQFG